jgi:adenine-specific DNA-methyltransferase
MDEVFGNENFVATVIWEKVYSPKSSAKYLSENHDYIVIYAKAKDSWKRRLLPRTEEANARYDNSDNDERGPWKPSDLSARNYYSKGTYPIECPGGRVIDGPPEGRYWAIAEDDLWDLDADNRIWWGEDRNGMPALKRFLSDVKDLVPETIWTYQEVGHSQDGKKEVIRILGGTDAPVTPKPVSLIERILWIASEPGDLILDATAGTGTTGHAALEMNAKDSDNPPRSFVLIQQAYDTKDNEATKLNLCEKLTAARVRRVMTGYDYKKRGAKGKTTKMHTDGLGGTFTYTRVGEPLFSEYRDFGKNLPDWETLARYVFYTETGRECDSRKFDPKSGFIGSIDAAGGTSYYLHYAPDNEENTQVSLRTLPAILERDKNKNLVIYAERIWLHGDELAKFEGEHGRKIRPMVIPFGLK